MAVYLEPPPSSTGQLWEECELCGAEPIWMPHMVCTRCWPKPPVAERRGPPGERFDKNDEELE